MSAQRERPTHVTLVPNEVVAVDCVPQDQAADSPIGSDSSQPESVSLEIGPVEWLVEEFPGLLEKHGDPLRTTTDRYGNQRVSELNEDFMAAMLGPTGCPAAPTVFLTAEARFYGYVDDKDDANHGIYVEVSKEALAARISNLLLKCARESESAVDCSALEFGLRSTRKLDGVIERAKAVLAVAHDFFETGHGEHLACSNGALRLADMALVPFSPDFRCRHKLGVAYIPDAICPMFQDVLLAPALHREDIELLQIWMGLALSGVNMAQVILLLIGTAGGGKGTLVRIINGILGAYHVAALRTKQLDGRFEIGRYLGRTLLYGADVSANCLNQGGASTLKQLTGGDPWTVELKNSNTRIDIICRFNVLLTANSRLKVKLEGDEAAWRRRLRIIVFSEAPPEQVIADLSERIIADEGSGVLNFMLEGLVKLRATGWLIPLTEQQQGRVDDLISESNSVRNFVAEKMVDAEGQPLTVTRAFTVYLAFCGGRGWTPLSREGFGRAIEMAVSEVFYISVRHDISDGPGAAQRGWKGVAIK